MTPAVVEELIKKAGEAAAAARAPYSGFKVGAAVLSADGRIFTGCNIENASLTLSVCAEKVALLKAISEGALGLKAIVVTSHTGQQCFPCGGCRQLLFEFAPEIKVILPAKNSVKTYTIRELLPEPFVKE
ncbi:MAG: cytidine deaminase [Actinomycetota bacterium]|nr:cytidine deaminase [Actinomycetota bacterium]